MEQHIGHGFGDGRTLLEPRAAEPRHQIEPVRTGGADEVEYPEEYDYGPWASRIEDLRVALATLLGREVDLIMPRAIRKKSFLQSVNETRGILYAP